MAETYDDYIFKILLVGDSGVGKPEVIFRFVEGAPFAMLYSKIGEFERTRTIELDGKRIILQMWDNAAMERYRGITTTFYRGAKGIMLVYDITNWRSFDNIRNWIRNIEEHASQDAEKMILGNKCDMNDRRMISKEEGEQLAIEHGIKFMEISAKANINVEEAFFTLARDIKAKMDRKMEASSPQPSGGGRQLKVNQSQPSNSRWQCTIL